MPTTSQGIWYPDDTAPISPIESIWAQQATTIDTALVGVRSKTPYLIPDQATQDLYYPSATPPPQGTRVVRQDLGMELMWLNVYNATTNPGGALSAGWYPVGGNMPYVHAVKSVSQAFSSGAFTNLNISAPSTKVSTAGFTFNAVSLVLPYQGFWNIEVELKFNDPGINSGGMYININTDRTSSDGIDRAQRGGGAQTAWRSVNLLAGQIASIGCYIDRSVNMVVNAWRITAAYLGPTG